MAVKLIVNENNWKESALGGDAINPLRLERQSFSHYGPDVEWLFIAGSSTVQKYAG